LVLGATAENVEFQPWWPLGLAMHKLGSTTTTVVNLQWTSDGYANMQGRTNTMAGSKLNTRWIMVNPYYIFKHKFNNHLPVLATLPQLSGSSNLFGLKQVLSTLAKPFLWLQTQTITKLNTSYRWQKASQSIRIVTTELCAKLHHLIIQSANTSMSRLINASFQAPDQHELKGAKVTSFLSEGASSNLAKDDNLMPPSDVILGTIIPSLFQWSSIGRPIKSSYIKPSKRQLKFYNARAPITGSAGLVGSWITQRA
jgi:hypothetical protein